jgi:Na+:H+ antiporter, NhaA family
LNTNSQRGWTAVVLDNSLLLVVGTLAALLWANLDIDAYDRIAHPLHFWVNDVGMVFFFALATKEIFEATLPGGALASPRQAAVPLAAAIGGMAAPAMIYVALVLGFGPGSLARGWAIPCATDIAFSAMIARLVFPKGHPAVPFLLLLAVADDALGLAILAIFYPSAPLAPAVFAAGMTAAVASAALLRRRRVRSFWPYVLGPGVLSWLSLYMGGFHPALALVPVVPFMPHQHRDLGVFDAREHLQPDTLNRFEHWWAVPVQVVLLLFGFANAGVPFTQAGPGTWYVLAALLIGKPVGIAVFTAASRLAGGRLPPGLRAIDVVLVGVTAAIGFTVALFFATAAFPEGAELNATKMGALASFLAAPLALVLGRLIRPRHQAA